MGTYQFSFSSVPISKCKCISWFVCISVCIHSCVFLCSYYCYPFSEQIYTKSSFVPQWDVSVHLCQQRCSFKRENLYPQWCKGMASEHLSYVFPVVSEHCSCPMYFCFLTLCQQEKHFIDGDIYNFTPQMNASLCLHSEASSVMTVTKCSTFSTKLVVFLNAWDARSWP